MSTSEPDSAGTSSHGLRRRTTLGLHKHAEAATTSTASASEAEAAVAALASMMEPPASIIMKAAAAAAAAAAKAAAGPVTTKEEPDCGEMNDRVASSVDSSMDSSALASCLSSSISSLRGSGNRNTGNGGGGNISGGDDNLSDNSESTSGATTTTTTSSVAAAQLLENLKHNLNHHSHNNNNTSVINNNNPLHMNNNNNNNGNRKLFECDVCNMKFSNGANMRRHKMRHTGVKPYECRVCQKRFFRKDHLAEHFTTHTKTLPYHCPICNRGFQRQIAMRAHFQNEHVGQHDLVKTCPLCSYRAGTMKSLRVHFFNRHGIDLDNPGPGTPSSLLLALDQHNPANLLPAALAAMNAVNASFGDGGTAAAAAAAAADTMQRSIDNGTPPMHFLTPHVEISMDNGDDENSLPLNCSRDGPTGTASSVGNQQELQQGNRSHNGTPMLHSNGPSHNDRSTPTTSSSSVTISSALDIQAIVRPANGGTPTIASSVSPAGSPHSADSNAPSSSQSSSSSTTNTMLPTLVQSSRHIIFDNPITPSISLIPIKQEPTTNDEYNDIKPRSSSRAEQPSSNMSNSTECVTPSSSLTSLIKVSPLKSLLREDLKRRISARATTRATRNGMLAKFPDQTLYFLHKGCHSESNPWKCNICGEQMNNVYEFNSHLLSKSHQ
uniref:C2H2-type domain-containing protein n=1 Tax=Anopheles epiroticus TaxID=199890 RepID=A0A182P7N4_9DIPT